MKNLLLVLLLIVSSFIYSQDQNLYMNGVAITDSNNILTVKKSLRIKGTQTTFLGASTPAGHTLSFDLTNDLGGIIIEKLNGTDLLIYDDDSKTWDFKFPITLNGVPITSGGGDAYLGNRQTFTKRNVFSDTIKADGEVFLNTYVTFNGEVVSDIDFWGGATRKIGTIDNQNFIIKRNNVDKITVGSGSVDFSSAVAMASTLNVGTLLTTDELSVSTSAVITSFGSDLYGAVGGLWSVGTTDNNAMAFLTNTTERMRIGTDSIKMLIPTKIVDKSLTITNTDQTKKVVLSANSSGDYVITPTGIVNPTKDIRFTLGAVAEFGTTDDFGFDIRTNGVDRIHIDTAGSTIFKGGANTITINTTSGYISQLGTFYGAVSVRTGSGSPEAVITANVGSLYLRTNGGANTTLYVKESGTGNTGWVAK